ncbi:MAG: GUN4 domain-containing protein [Geitlerinemataceae cyanobacterium]
MRAICLSNGQPITLGRELGGGGEGKIYPISGYPSVVAKVYHPNQRSVERDRKLRVMYANSPGNSTSIAWPLDLLRDPDGTQAIGFVMRRVTRVRPLHDVYNPKTRRQQMPFFDYYYLHRTARNLAAAIATIHANGYTIGDVNESNILVSPRALVTLVDTDSFQVCDRRSGAIYRCPVGKPEFTPPELQGEAFAKVDRTPEHDRFGLAVLIFQLLMEGTHPFDGVYLGQGDPPPKEARIAAGHFPYRPNSPYRPKPFAPPSELLHPQLRKLFWQCFEGGYISPKLRPSAVDWVDALSAAEAELIPCAVNAQHRYGKHLKSCPWCDRSAQLGGRDPFPGRRAPRPKAMKPKPRVPRVVASPVLSVRQPPVSYPTYSAYPTRKPTPPKFDPISFVARKAFLLIGVGTALVMAALADSVYLQSQQEGNWTDALTTLWGEEASIDCTTTEFSSTIAAGFSQEARLAFYRCQFDRAQKLANAGRFPQALHAIQGVPVEGTAQWQPSIDRWSRQILDRAALEYESGRFELASNLMKTIPETSSIVTEARTALDEWTLEWQENLTRWQTAQTALKEARYDRAKTVASQLTTPYWQERGRSVFDEAYFREAEAALAAGRLDAARQAAEQIDHPSKRDRIANEIEQVAALERDREVDLLYLESARQALAEGRFQDAKQEADRAIGSLSRSQALKLYQKADYYSRLQNLLAAQKWESASLITRSKLLAFARESFSCEDVRTIDRLWVESSQGRFGLSVQLRYKEVEGILGHESLSPKQQLELAEIYPSRPSFGTYGTALDNQLKSCGI